jgi:NhaA family Na+:H+ antiporter
LSLRHLVVLGVVAGVGLTMALFTAQPAFTDAGLFSAAKLGVLTASAGAAILGLVCGRVLLTPRSAEATATENETEGSTES